LAAPVHFQPLFFSPEPAVFLRGDVMGQPALSAARIQICWKFERRTMPPDRDGKRRPVGPAAALTSSTSSWRGSTRLLGKIAVRVWLFFGRLIEGPPLVDCSTARRT
jgi:hypothetical protein